MGSPTLLQKADAALRTPNYHYSKSRSTAATALTSRVASMCPRKAKRGPLSRPSHSIVKGISKEEQ